MRRKIVQQGYSTLMISLPSEWTKKNKLTKGDEIDVNEANNLLIVSRTQIKEEKKEIEINIENLNPLINRIISSLYKKGYDTINIKFKTQGILNKIQKEVLPELIGFEIIDQGKDFCKLAEITKISFKEFDTVLTRILFTIRNMLSELTSSIEKKEKDLSYIKYMDFYINKYHLFCIRIINKNLIPDATKSHILYSIVTSLEILGDTIKEFINLMENIQLSKNEINLIRETKTIFNEFHKLYNDFDINNASHIARKWQNLIDENKFEKLIEFKIKEILFHIIRLLDNTIILNI